MGALYLASWQYGQRLTVLWLQCESLGANSVWAIAVPSRDAAAILLGKLAMTIALQDFSVQVRWWGWFSVGHG